FFLLGSQGIQLDFLARPGCLPRFLVIYQRSSVANDRARILGIIQVFDDGIFLALLDVRKFRLVASHVGDLHGGRSLRVVRIQLASLHGVRFGLGVAAFLISRVILLHLLGDQLLLVLLGFGLALA